MAFLAKSTVLKAYQLLSEIDADKRQGLTQKVSALKYASALDMFYKRHQRNCDLKQSPNRDLFSSYVGEIVKINDDYCTKDFFLSISPNGRDFDCGSNFFSQSSVKDSKTNPDNIFLYPKRSGWKPVMDVQNEMLVYRPEYLMDAFSFYLGSTELKLAYIIWLLRFTEIGEENLKGLRAALDNLFTNDFSNALYDSSINSISYSYITFNDKICQLNIQNIQSLFDSDERHFLEEHTMPNLPLQQIFYGAPGTGKSHIVKEITRGESVIRTTFHPDSDYSTFVGAYKPTTRQVTLRDLSGHPVKENGVTLTEDKIIYEFVDQAFLQAYVRAWKYFAEANESSEPKKQYLIIEEINRGNCAQIFGDLFQLLDRNACGFSDYPVHADNDIRKQLAKAFNGLSIAQADRINACCKGEDVVSKVLSGEILLLPGNLYIWATMNTSDQSLFPIDSAFKRRWDWQYMPICKGRDANGNELEWRIVADTKEYDWWAFLEKINVHIGSITSSEDKKLGFFFCKPDDGRISCETFVGKVIFYLWNDVFKDFGFDDDIFKDSDGSKLSFDKFYATDGQGKAVVRKDKVELFLNNLEVGTRQSVEPYIDDPLPEVDEDGNDDLNAIKDFSRYSINGAGSYSKGGVVFEAMKIYIANNPQKNAEEIKDDWLALGVKSVYNFVETQEMFDERKQKSRDSRINEKTKRASLKNGQAIYVSNQYNPDRIAEVVSKINAADWNITISKV